MWKQARGQSSYTCRRAHSLAGGAEPEGDQDLSASTLLSQPPLDVTCFLGATVSCLQAHNRSSQNAGTSEELWRLKPEMLFKR